MRAIHLCCTSQGRDGIDARCFTQNRCVNFQRKLDIGFGKISLRQRPIEIGRQIGRPGIVKPVPAMTRVEWRMKMVEKRRDYSQR